MANDRPLPVLKKAGYTTGMFGKWGLGHEGSTGLPTRQGFDEFFGNLYHLNAEQEPEHPDYPKDPEFRKKFGPRGVIKSSSDGKIEDTGPMTRKRMELDDEQVKTAEDVQEWLDRQVANNDFHDITVTKESANYRIEN